MKILHLFFGTPLTVKIEIDTKFFTSLIETGQIHVTDFRCLDLSSKQIVWRKLLSLAKSRFSNEGKQLEDQ